MQNSKMKSMKNGFVKILGLIIIVLFVGGGVFLLSSDSFEREAPSIAIKDGAIWNFKEPLSFAISDNFGVKSYRVAQVENGQKIPLETRLNAQNFTHSDEKFATTLDIGVERLAHIDNDVKSIVLEVEATDTSWWNFFSGNTTTQQFNLTIDVQSPKLAVVANSYKITQGGSALVVFHALDEHLEDITLTNGNLEFKVQPFYKEGFYIALIAWSKIHDDFNARIIAKDKAGNMSVVPIDYFQQKKRYKDSTIPLTDAFVDGKISMLVEEIGEKSLEEFANKVDIFRYINEDVRQQSFDRIFNVASALDAKMAVESFPISPFDPLKNAAVTASFGDHRTFTYQGKYVSESNHLGLDLASIKQAPVILSNPGVVILNDFVGIDGNVIVVYHGLGLSTLYAHLTTSNVNVGDMLDKGSVIAKTGDTGLALGDHLHFGVLVQGYEVWNAEWMDSNWIKLNITNVIAEAKAIINQI